jgi:hypothetical protein
MGRTENDPNPTCAESIDACAVSFGSGEVENDKFRWMTDLILYFLFR